MESKLFEPYRIGNVTLKNRIVMSPMCMYSVESEDGIITDWHFTHYESRAIGQVGLVMLEATAVAPEGRISSRDLGLWSDDHINGLSEAVRRIKRHGAKAAIQIAHAGRKADIEGDILAPSPLAFNERYKEPKEMTGEEIANTITAFKSAASRAKSAGFDVIEIHAAHGYLINQFLSPLTNKRGDEYGGSLKGPYTLLRQVIDEVKKVWDGPIFVRVSAHEYAEGGLTPEDYVTMAEWMKQQGVDLIDVSSGAVVPARISVYPGYQVKFAETIRTGASIPTGAVGLITTGIQAEEILQNQRADLIFIGRELLKNPYWPRTAAQELGVSIEPPTQYKRGWE